MPTTKKATKAKKDKSVLDGATVKDAPDFLEIKGDGGVITFSARKGSLGFWMSEKGQLPCVAVYFQDGQPVIGFYAKNSGTAMAMAFTVGDEGEPCLQVAPKNDGDKAKWIRLSALQAAEGLGAWPAKPGMTGVEGEPVQL